MLQLSVGWIYWLCVKTQRAGTPNFYAISLAFSFAHSEVNWLPCCELPCGDIHMVKNIEMSPANIQQWNDASVQQPANLDFPKYHLNKFVIFFLSQMSLPMKPQPQPVAWWELNKRIWPSTTQLSCTCSPNSEKLWENKWLLLPNWS